MMQQPETLTVTVMDVGALEIDAGPNANLTAFQIMRDGLRLFNKDTLKAAFYPPWRIIYIEGQWEE